MVPLPIQVQSRRRFLHYPLHYPLHVMLVCVRWYPVYPLSLRSLEDDGRTRRHRRPRHRASLGAEDPARVDGSVSPAKVPAADQFYSLAF